MNLLLLLVIVSSSIITFYIGYKYGRGWTANVSGRCKLSVTLSMGESTVHNATSDDSKEVSITARYRVESSLYKVDGNVHGGILQEAFYQLHHPGTPLTTEIIMNLHHNVSTHSKETNPYVNCNEVYLTRTGSRVSMSNKCLAVTYVSDGSHSPYRHSHRAGTQAAMVDRYQPDNIDDVSLSEEEHYLPIFLKSINKVIKAFKIKVGDPLLPDGSRRAITIMVVNEGVLDLLMNFLCSCRSAGIDVSSDSSSGRRVVVFIGQEELSPVIESMGVIPFYHEALGPIPKQAAGFYGDGVFGIMMWMKATSIYVASKAGYDVLFQGDNSHVNGGVKSIQD